MNDSDIDKLVEAYNETERQQLERLLTLYAAVHERNSYKGRYIQFSNGAKIEQFSERPLNPRLVQKQLTPFLAFLDKVRFE